MSTMIDKSAVEAIAALQRTACTPSLIQIPGDDTRLLLVHGDTAEFLVVPPRRRDHRVDNINSFSTAVTLYEIPVIYHRDDFVVGIINDDDRKDFVTWDLKLDSRWGILRSLIKPSSFDHKSFIRWLRVDMRGAITRDFIDSIRSINFSQLAEGDSYIATGTEKMGKSVVAKVNIKGDLPDEIKVSCPIYSSYGANQHYSVSLMLDIDVQAQRFVVQFPESEMTTAENAFANWMQAELSNNCPNAHVFAGTPNL